MRPTDIVSPFAVKEMQRPTFQFPENRIKRPSATSWQLVRSISSLSAGAWLLITLVLLCLVFGAWVWFEILQAANDQDMNRLTQSPSQEISTGQIDDGVKETIP